MRLSLQIFTNQSLYFDSDFECGNLSSSQRVNEYEYDLFIKSDSSENNVRLNYYFRIYNIQDYMINKPILFNIIGISKNKTSYDKGQQILVRSVSNPKWSCIPAQQTFYYYSSRHQAYTNNQILSFIFIFDKIEDYYISFGYPYTYTMLETYINKLQQYNFNNLSIQSLGQTYDNNKLYLLNIGNPNAQHKVFISSRCHPGEFPGSYICHGIIEYLLSSNQHAQQLVQKVQFHIVPMINPDGVIRGNYRCNARNIDINRTFDKPNKEKSIESFYIRNFITDLLYQKRQDILKSYSSCIMNKRLNQLAQQYNISTIKGKLQKRDQKEIQAEDEEIQQKQTLLNYIIDIHSHSNLIGGFIYQNPDNYVLRQVERQNAEKVFPAILASKCIAFGDIQSVSKESQGKREGSIRRAFNSLGKDYQGDGAPHTYCIEVSNSGGPDPRYENPNINTIQNQNKEFNVIKYTPSDYIQIGYKICETLFKIYDFNDSIL